MNFYELLFNKGKPAGEGMTHFERLFALKLGGGSGGEIKELEGVPPLTFKADGSPLIDWYIKGNTTQSGTPAPSSPVDVVGTGERTENLFDDHNIITIAGLGDRYGVVLPPGTYSIYNGTDNLVYDGLQDFQNRHVACEAHSTATVTLATDPGTTCGFLMGLNAASQGGVTIVPGSTAPSSYIPYGYKLDISSANTTTPVYLGEVETTRKIKKLVLTGEESGWQLYQQSSPLWQYKVYQFWHDNIIDSIQYSSLYSTIAPFGATSQSRPNYEYGCYAVSSGKGLAFQMAGAKDTFANITAWKSYLAQQYAAGTPVTVWYVLATPQTAVVNEPLMKIGDYADSLTATQAGTEIATVKGSNTLDIDTTVKPSNVYIKYKD